MKMKNLRKLLMALLMMLSMPLIAEHVSETTAQRIAENFLKAKTHSKVEVALLDFEEKSAFTNFYVFGNEHCFVIVSADDCVHPILGYSTENGFGTRQMPENVKDLFNGFNDDITYAKNNKTSCREKIQDEWAKLFDGEFLVPKHRDHVDALIQTQWDQDDPYNLMCPEGCVTGCVATAMAQIMKYWNYPSYGIGSYSYNENGRSHSVDFGITDYDWSNMTSHYSSESSEIEKQAVATLMYYCGVSAKMQYGSTSGAYSDDARNAFSKYFDYKQCIFTYRDFYGFPEWTSMIKNEIDSGRPVLYSGGIYFHHAFICDGYDENDFFHLNFGWGGDSDGFYDIMLDEKPDDYSFESYFWHASAILGIEPYTSLADIPSGFICEKEEDGVRLSWDNANNAEQYYIYKNYSLIDVTSESTYLDSQVSTGTSYYYIKSVDIEGNASPASRTCMINYSCDEIPLAFYFDGDDITSCLGDCLINDGFYTDNTCGIRLRVSETTHYGDHGNALCFTESEWFSSHQGNNWGRIVFPELDLSLINTGIEIDFMCKSPGYDFFLVQYSIDGIDWITASSPITTVGNEWNPISVMIPEVANYSTVVLSLVYYADLYAESFIDNLEVKAAPDCYAPVNVIVSNITHNSAVVSWGNAPSTNNFILAFGERGTELVNMQVIQTENNAYTLLDLNPITEYEVFLKALCLDNTETEWVGPFTFGTKSSPTLPIYESFDSACFPANMTIEGFFSNHVLIANQSNYQGEGFCLKYDPVFERPVRVVLPTVKMMDVEEGLELNLKWFCEKLGFDSPQQAQVQIQYSIDGCSWVDIGDPIDRFIRVGIETEVGSTWQPYRICIPKVGNENQGYVALSFSAWNIFTEISCYVDDIELRSVSCFSPTNLFLFAYSMDVAEVSWSQVENPYLWEVAYGIKGTSVEEMSRQFSESNSIILDLESGMEYEVYVKSVCSEIDESDWSIPLSFKLPCMPDISRCIDFNECVIPDCFIINGQAPSFTNELYQDEMNYCLKVDGSSRLVVPVDFQYFSSGALIQFDMYHFNNGYNFYGVSSIQIQYSFDGQNWINFGESISRESSDGSSYWENESILLPNVANYSLAYIGLSFVPGPYSCDNYIDNLIIKGVNNIEEIIQAFPFSLGWSWYAPTVQTSIESIQSSLGNNLQFIQSKDDGTPCGEIIPGQMYRIQTTVPCTLAVVGMPITSATVAITQGTNWFGCIGSEVKPIASAITIAATEGDKVISQDGGFAIYNGTEWQGTLTTLQPGCGYVYYSASSEPKTLIMGQ